MTLLPLSASAKGGGGVGGGGAAAQPERASQKPDLSADDSPKDTAGAEAGAEAEAAVDAEAGADVDAEAVVEAEAEAEAGAEAEADAVPEAEEEAKAAGTVMSDGGESDGALADLRRRERISEGESDETLVPPAMELPDGHGSDGHGSDGHGSDRHGTDEGSEQGTRRMIADYSSNAGFGELWEDRVSRLRAASPIGSSSAWRLTAFIAKASSALTLRAHCMPTACPLHAHCVPTACPLHAP